MSLLTLARRDALDPYRSGSLWVLLGVFALAFGFVGYLLADGTGQVAVLFAQILVLFGPLAALSFSYQSIAGPRENGSLRVLLSYPYTRREVVLGKLLGRVAVLSLAVVVGVLVGWASMLVFGGSPDPVAVLGTLALALVLTASIVGVSVGISAGVATTNRAAVGAFAAYLLFSGFWSLVPSGIRYVLNGLSMPASGPPEWVFVWRQLNPFNAFRSAVQALTDAPLSEAFYHAPWFSLLVLVGWFVLLVVVGTLRFERADL